VTRSAVERMLKRQVDVEVAFDGIRPEQAAVDGVILSVTNPKSEITRATEALTNLLEAKHGSGAARRTKATPAAISTEATERT
jgi:MinD-like ATPase involved in chromosome partitioning or flagellar assembly